MPAQFRIRVSLVDPDDHFRLLLATKFQTSPRHLLLHCSSTAHEARAWLTTVSPDVVLVAHPLPDADSADLIRSLIERFPQTLFIALATDATELQVAHAIQAGAHGFLQKSDGPAAIFTAIDDALGGGAPLSRFVARDVVRILRSNAAPFSPP